MKKKTDGWGTMTAIKLPVWIHFSRRVLLLAGVHDINLSHGAVASDMALGLRFFPLNFLISFVIPRCGRRNDCAKIR
jgi:hypothetical protein